MSMRLFKCKVCGNETDATSDDVALQYVTQSNLSPALLEVTCKLCKYMWIENAFLPGKRPQDPPPA